MRGLDPRIHLLAKEFLAKNKMDPRVKPAGDACGMTASAAGKAPVKSAPLKVWGGRRRGGGRYEGFDGEFEDGDSVLDGLVRIRLRYAPDLAIRFSCFNANV